MDDVLSVVVTCGPVLAIVVLMALAVRRIERDRVGPSLYECREVFLRTLPEHPALKGHFEITSPAPWHRRLWNLATNPWRYLFTGKWRL
jgi:hypothetical protein